MCDHEWLEQEIGSFHQEIDHTCPPTGHFSGDSDFFGFFLVFSNNHFAYLHCQAMTDDFYWDMFAGSPGDVRKRVQANCEWGSEDQDWSGDVFNRSRRWTHQLLISRLRRDRHRYSALL